MKLTRHYAINVLFARLEQMALGHMDETTLEALLTNIESLRKVAEDFELLKKELFKRIYGDVEQMTEEQKNDIRGFFEMLENGKADEAKDAYPDMIAKREKEIKVIVSLLNKEIDVEIASVDEKAFVKGLLLGNKDVKASEARAVFAPLFVTHEREEADFSELDELI